MLNDYQLLHITSRLHTVNGDQLSPPGAASLANSPYIIAGSKTPQYVWCD